MVYLLNSFLNWRMIALTSVAIALCGFCQSFFIPETKYWYLLNDNRDGAVASLLWFQPKFTEDELEREIKSISQSIDEDPNAKSGHFVELIKNLRYKKYFRPVLLGFIVTFLRGSNGRVVFGIYLINIFKHLEIPYHETELGILFGIVEMIGSMAVLFFIYKYNRKIVIYVVSSIMFACITVTILYKFLHNCKIDVVPAWLVVCCIYIYTVLSSTAMNSSLAVISSEIQHAYYRAEVVAFNSGTIFFFFGLYTFLYPYIEKILAIEYIIMYFEIIVALTVVVIYFFFPETSKFEFFQNDKKQAQTKALLQRK